VRAEPTAQRSPFALKSPVVHHEYRGRFVLVFDDVLPVRLVAALGQFMLRLKYARRSSFDNELSADVDNELLESLPGLPDATAESLRHHDAKASAVTPKPGRFVLFNAQLAHRTGIPMRDCPSHRYAMSVFMRCKPQIEASKRYFADASKKARALDATSSKS
jgi:hypothetical protein